PLVRRVAGVEGVEHQLDATSLVLPVQLGIPVVVADQRSAANTVDLPRAEVVPRRVVRQVPGRPGAVAGAEALVVAVDDLTAAVDDVDAVVRFVPAAEAVRRPEDDPHPQLPRQLQDLLRGTPRGFPVVTAEIAEVHT